MIPSDSRRNSGKGSGSGFQQQATASTTEPTTVQATATPQKAPSADTPASKKTTGVRRLTPAKARTGVPQTAWPSLDRSKHAFVTFCRATVQASHFWLGASPLPGPSTAASPTLVAAPKSNRKLQFFARVQASIPGAASAPPSQPQESIPSPQLSMAALDQMLANQPGQVVSKAVDATVVSPALGTRAAGPSATPASKVSKHQQLDGISRRLLSPEQQQQEHQQWQAWRQQEHHRQLQRNAAAAPAQGQAGSSAPPDRSTPQQASTGSRPARPRVCLVSVPLAGRTTPGKRSLAAALASASSDSDSDDERSLFSLVKRARRASSQTPQAANVADWPRFSLASPSDEGGQRSGAARQSASGPTSPGKDAPVAGGDAKSDLQPRAEAEAADLGSGAGMEIDRESMQSRKEPAIQVGSGLDKACLVSSTCHETPLLQPEQRSAPGSPGPPRLTEAGAEPVGGRPAPALAVEDSRMGATQPAASGGCDGQDLTGQTHDHQQACASLSHVSGRMSDEVSRRVLSRQTDPAMTLDQAEPGSPPALALELSPGSAGRSSASALQASVAEDMDVDAPTLADGQPASLSVGASGAASPDGLTAPAADRLQADKCEAPDVPQVPLSLGQAKDGLLPPSGGFPRLPAGTGEQASVPCAAGASQPSGPTSELPLSTAATAVNACEKAGGGLQPAVLPRAAPSSSSSDSQQSTAMVPLDALHPAKRPASSSLASPQPTFNPFERSRRQAQMLPFGGAGGPDRAGAAAAAFSRAGAGAFAGARPAAVRAVGSASLSASASTPGQGLTAAGSSGAGAKDPHAAARLSWLKSPKQGMLSPAARFTLASRPGGPLSPAAAAGASDPRTSNALLQGLPPEAFTITRSLAPLPPKSAHKRGVPQGQTPSSPVPLPSPTQPPCMTLEQSYREAYIDAQLARKWYAEGCVWARMDVHGLEITEQPLEKYESRLTDTQQRFQGLRGQASVASLASALEREWHQLQIFRTTLHARTRPPPSPAPACPAAQQQQQQQDPAVAGSVPRASPIGASDCQALAPACTPPGATKQASDKALTGGVSPSAPTVAGGLEQPRMPPASILKCSSMERRKNLRRVSFGDQLEIGPCVAYGGTSSDATMNADT